MQSKIKIGVILTDTHFPYQDETTLRIALEICKDLQPNFFVHLGDAMDCNGISKYTAKTITDGLPQVLKEIKMFQEYLHKVRNICKKLERVQFFLGNHDGQRISDTLDKMEQKGEYEALAYWKEQFNFKKLFPHTDVYQYNQIAKLGQTNSKLYGTHGEFHGGNHLKKHLESYGCTIVYGHLHTSASYSAVTKSDGNPRKAITLPCSCNTNPAYMKNKASSWINGLAVFYMLPNGLFNLYPLEIIKGKLLFNNKIYQ